MLTEWCHAYLQAGGGNAVAGAILHGGARVGGEAYFVRKPDATAEDDGWLITLVTDQDSLQSECVVFDAASMSSTPVARVRMGRLAVENLWGNLARGMPNGLPAACGRRNSRSIDVDMFASTAWATAGETLPF